MSQTEQTLARIKNLVSGWANRNPVRKVEPGTADELVWAILTILMPDTKEAARAPKARKRGDETYGDYLTHLRGGDPIALIKAFQAHAEGIEWMIEWKLVAFDPGFTFEDSRGQRVTLNWAQVQDIEDSWTIGGT